MPQIFLVHPTLATIAPMAAPFREEWPEARAYNLVDDSLYGEIDADGTITPSIIAKVSRLFDYCEAAGADAALFTGSTFGPAVSAACEGRALRVLRPDDALADAVIAADAPAMVLCTARRAIPVIIAGIRAAAAAAGRTVAIEGHWVPEAQALAAAGDTAGHDRLIAGHAATLDPAHTLVLGQISMAPSRPLVEAAFAGRIVTSPSASIGRLKAMLARKGEP